MKIKTTVEKIMLHNMSAAINSWLHDKGDSIKQYGNFLDRVCEIRDVLSKSLEKTTKQLKTYDPETCPVEIEFFS